MELVDVWLIALGTDDREATVHAFAAEFDMSVDRARDVTARLPRVVLRAVPGDEAAEFAKRLDSVGVVSQVRPSAPAIELSPGSRPNRPSQPVAAAPPVSLFPKPIVERAHSLRPSSRPRGSSLAPPAIGSRMKLALGFVAIVAGVAVVAITHVLGFVAIALVTIGVVLVVTSRNPT